MELFEHLNQLKKSKEVIDFVEKHKNNKFNFFGINYKNKERVSFKLYSTLTDFEELKNFDSSIYNRCKKYSKLMWYSGVPGERELHIGYKLKNSQIVKYFHCKFKPDVYLFSIPYPECSFQGMSVESNGELRPYFYYFSKQQDYYNAIKCNCFKKILTDHNCNTNKGCDEIFNIEYTITKDYKKMNLGINIAPFDEFKTLDELAKSDSILLEDYFKQKIITTGMYNDNTIAVYYYNCFKKLLE